MQVESGIPIFVGPKGYLSISVKFPYADVEGDGVNKWLAIISVTADNRPVENAEIYVNDKLVGYTNSSGQLSYVFEPGKSYIIVAKKMGYVSVKISLG